jgi:predicted dehydrogenase
MIKAGIIGLGVGEQHISGYEAHPSCEVVAACDLSKEKLESVRIKYPKINYTLSPNEILDDPSIGVVSIASYDNHHCEQILRALKNDKHVFVEKPLVLFEKEAQAVKKLLLEKPHLKLSSNLILRKYPRFETLKQLIAKGDLGKIYYLEASYEYGRLQKLTEGWRAEIPYYSVVSGGGVHMIDLLLWLTGKKVTEVSAFGNRISTENSKFKHNDLVAALLKFEDGSVAQLSANFGSVAPHFHAVSIFGTEGTFKNAFEAGYLYKTRDPDITPSTIKTPYPGAKKGDFLRGFIDSILGLDADLVRIDEIFCAMSICFAIEKAVQENSVVKVKYI